MSGVVEVLGAVGLILPPLTGIAPILAPIAAIGLVLVQLGAVVFHLRRGEAKVVPMNLVLLMLAVAAAVLGFIVWA
ncbi:DoxX family protein [Microbacterium sp. Clip185]|uniref:DoxX family protein n=1 Tax=Microbacterium sp. Clip185 TaxID=3025663 RepID=UPI002365AAC6|nr:DoxX family protein [Microbacterium sp. Clip185]WDG18187.1 DoxX family protein [Microbacterium sp. Clip185]